MRKYLVTALIIMAFGSLSAFGRKETVPAEVADYNFDIAVIGGGSSGFAGIMIRTMTLVYKKAPV